jgi:hypothetical protein
MPVVITIARIILKMSEELTNAEIDAAWLFDELPDATENEIEYFCERVAMLEHMAGNEVDDARKKSLFYLKNNRRNK